jgi:hypothetical protein
VCLGAALVGLGCLYLQFGTWDPGSAIPRVVLLLPPAVAVWLVGVRRHQDWRAWQMSRAGAGCGLRRRRLGKEDLAALDSLPLSRVVGPGRLSGSSWCLEGRLDDFPVRVLDLGYHLRGERETLPGLLVSTVQTVAVLSGLGLGMRFYLGPPRCAWDDLAPAWPGAQGLVLSKRVDDDGWPLCVLHTSVDGAVSCLSPQVLDELSRLGGLVVECHEDTVMIYRHLIEVSPDELQTFLETVRRVAHLLVDAVPVAEPIEPPRPPGQSIRPDPSEP